MLTSGWRAFACWVASIPPIPGMLMSMTMTAGFRRSTISSACAPSWASPTTSMSDSLARIIRTPSRTIAWSSASNTLIFAITHSYGNGSLQARAGTGRRLDRERPAQQFCALPHPEQTHPALAAGGHRVGIKSAAIVADDQIHAAVAVGDLHPGVGGASMLQNVRQCLLGNAEDRSLDVRRKAFI